MLTRDPKAKCTEKDEDNTESMTRLQRCSSLTDCYDESQNLYDNEKCESQWESCAKFKVDDEVKSTCILTKYCAL